MVATRYEGATYLFTVGLERNFAHPNLEAICWDEGLGKNCLVALVEEIQAGERFRSGDFFHSLAESHDLLLVENPADPTGAPITGGRLRLVWPDAQQRYPWDANCSDPCAAQTYIPPICGIDLENLHLLAGVPGPGG